MRFEWKDTLTGKVGGSVHSHAGWVYLSVITTDGANNACYTDPATGRQIAHAILAACDEIDPPKVEPVRIDRWLTPEDVEAHGNRWTWHGQWHGGPASFTARIDDGIVGMFRGRDPYDLRHFTPGDYFTPIP